MMTKGTKIFRIIISVLLGLTMLFSAFFIAVFVFYIETEVDGVEYGINVAGVDVTRDNEDDILGDGTVYYDHDSNVLTFENAEIEYDYSIVYSRIDLMIELIGENKFVMSGDTVPVLHISEYRLSKDLAVFGDGSLTVEFEGACENAQGILARNIRIETDIAITMPDCSNIANGIYSDATLILSNGATVTLENGAAAYSTAVKARNNVDIEMGSVLNVIARPGTTEMCRGLNVGGSLTVWENSSLNVSIDDTSAKTSECIAVPALLCVKQNASVTASAKKSYGIACYGSMELIDGATVSASREGEGVDLLCYGTIVNYGATVNGEAEALGGVVNK
jgi:hypothetical protein